MWGYPAFWADQGYTEFSDDLASWQTWTSGPAPEDRIQQRDPNARERSQRYYRAVLP